MTIKRKNRAAVLLAKARAKKLSPERRLEISRIASAASVKAREERKALKTAS